MSATLATLTFFGAIAALVMAIRGREKLRKGVNSYERAQNRDIAAWNRIYMGAFWVAFGCAAAMLAITVFPNGL